MMRRFIFVVALMLQVGCLVSTAAADDFQKRFIQARQLMHLQRWDQALGLMEGVVPETDEQWTMRESLLAEIYRGQKNYGSLELLARQALERSPNRPDRTQWMFLRGELLLLADHLDSARSLLDSLWRADPTDSTIVRVAQLYEQHSVADLALTTLVEARVVLEDSTRYALPLAALYEARRDYAGATAEYFHALDMDTALTRQVENRVLQLVQTEEGREAIEHELQRAAGRADAAVPARNLLVTLYLEEGQPDRAWQAAWEVDSLTAQGGVSLIMFMRQATERGYYAVATDAAARVLSHYPTSPVRHQAEWELAQLSLRTGDWPAAADQLQEMATTSPVQRFRVEAALSYAQIQAEQFSNLSTADSTFESVAMQNRAGIYYGKAMLGRALVAIARGDIAAARAVLVSLSEAQAQGDIREQLTYMLGELSYFEGDLEAAQEVWTSLTVDFPRGIWVNNALRQVLLLSAYAAVAPADLKLLGRAEALSRRNQPDSALALVAGLRATKSAPLAPRATVLSAEWHSQARRPESALALWDYFVAAYPEDPDAPRALVMSARVCESTLSQPDAALLRYNKLLEDYPRSHWAEDARSRLRFLGGL
jgi:outer membrane protein assembly factor BamD (BamD/ComL family)